MLLGLRGGGRRWRVDSGFPIYRPRRTVSRCDARQRASRDALDGVPLGRGSSLLRSRPLPGLVGHPNDRMMRYDETDGSVSVFRQPSHNANGNTVDREGRLVSCEHQCRCVTRTEHDGSRTVLVRALPGQTPELTQRRGGQIRRQHLVLRSDLRHRFRLRRRRRSFGDRRLLRLPPRSGDRRLRGGGDRFREAQWAGLLTR